MLKTLPNKIKENFLQIKIIKHIQLLRTKKNYKNISHHIFNRFDEKSSFIIHIPKTAGTSVTKSIYGTDAEYYHYKWDELKIIMEENFYNYFSFSIVRNPWDRCLSAYEFLRLGGDNNKDRKFFQEHMSIYNSFEDFVKNGLIKKKILNGIHFMPQSNFIFSDNDKCMVDYLLRFETINTDYNLIKKKIGGSNLLKYKINRTNHNYHKQYDTKMKNIISEVYSRDINLLEYSF